jgi:hypothetical protein
LTRSPELRRRLLNPSERLAEKHPGQRRRKTGLPRQKATNTRAV